VPRDRNGSFEPGIVPNGSRRVEGIDRLVISLYARGVTVRDIQDHLAEICDITVRPDLISKITDGVLEEVREWKSRPLDAVYPVVFVDSGVRSITASAPPARLVRVSRRDSASRLIRVWDIAGLLVTCGHEERLDRCSHQRSRRRPSC
jgi:hypothetical protein